MARDLNIRNSCCGLLISDGQSVKLDERSRLMSDRRIWRSEGGGWTLLRPEDVWDVAQSIGSADVMRVVRSWLRRLAQLSADEQTVVLMSMARRLAGVDQDYVPMTNAWRFVDARVAWGNWDLVATAEQVEDMDSKQLAQQVLESAGYQLGGVIAQIVELAETAAELLTG